MEIYNIIYIIGVVPVWHLEKLVWCFNKILAQQVCCVENKFSHVQA